MNDVYAKLKELGLELPAVPPKGGVYSSAKRFGGNLIYISGCGPVIDAPVTGRVGQTMTKEEAQVQSRNSMLNVLAVLEKEIGDLNKVKQVVKILVFVNSADDFYEQPFVANGGSQLLVDLFGEGAGGEVKDLVGHSEDMDTFGVYAHTLAGDAENTARAVNGVFLRVLKNA